MRKTSLKVGDKISKSDLSYNEFLDKIKNIYENLKLEKEGKEND